MTNDQEIESVYIKSVYLTPTRIMLCLIHTEVQIPLVFKPMLLVLIVASISP